MRTTHHYAAMLPPTSGVKAITPAGISATSTVSGSVPAHVIVDSSANLGSTNPTNFTCSGVERYLIVGFAVASPSIQVSTLTYGGVSMTRLGRIVSGSIAAELWGLVNPASGSNAIAYTWTGAAPTHAHGAVSFNYVNQSTPDDGNALGTSGTGTVATSGAKTGVGGDMLVDIVAANSGVTISSGTQAWNDGGGDAQATLRATGSSQTISWTLASATWAEVVARLVYSRNSLSGAKPITPTTISATSTMGGSVLRVKKILPTTVSATSTVSGSVRAIHKISGVISATSTVSGGISGKTLWVGDYETGDYSQWWLKQWDSGVGDNTIDEVGNTKATIVTSPRRQGTYASKFEVFSTGGGASANNRSEALADVARSGGTVGEEWYYGWHTYFPSGQTFWAGGADWNGFTQFQADGGAWVLFGIDNTGAQPVMYHDQPDGTHTAIGNLVFDHWYHFVVHAKWKADGTGIWEVWVDGTQILSRSIATVPTGTSVIRVSQGFYSTRLTNNTVIHDGMIVADTFARVNNYQGAIQPISPAVVSATATVSGSILRVKKILPTTISATSTVSGSVITIHKISGVISATSTVSGSILRVKFISGAISATSTVTGKVTAIHRISGVVSAISTVSGAVSRLKPILPTAISATSTVSGSVQRIRPITPAAISATSTVTGRVVKLARISGVVSATSTVSGAVTAVHRVSGAISATSTVSGTIVRLRPIVPAAISATSTVSGGIGRLRPITPTAISATSTVSGSVRAIHKISGVISATATVSGSIRIGGKISGAAIAATSTVTGSVAVRRKISPTLISATSTVSGAIGRIRHFVGAISATSTVSGKVAALRKISGVISATSTVSGTVVARRRISGVVTATSTVSGSIRRIIHPTGVILATSTVTGTVVKLGLRGIILATATVSGHPIVRRRISGVITATSTLAGSVHRLRRVAGIVLATSTVTGSVKAKKRISGFIVATSSVHGSVVRVIHPRGLISATSTLHGAVAKRFVIRGNILATSSVTGGFQPGRIVYGKERPRITSARYDIPELTSTSYDKAVLERVQ